MAQTPYPYVAPVPVEDIGRLLSDSITKKDYEALREDIEARFAYVFEKMMALMGREFDWYDFDNEGGERSPGFFDPRRYRDDIGVIISGDTGSGNEYANSIPVAWLSEDFEDNLLAELAQHKMEKEQKALRAKQKREEKAKDAVRIRASIKSKLTAEELKFIGFK